MRIGECGCIRPRTRIRSYLQYPQISADVPELELCTCGADDGQPAVAQPGPMFDLSGGGGAWGVYPPLVEDSSLTGDCKVWSGGQI